MTMSHAIEAPDEDNTVAEEITSLHRQIDRAPEVIDHLHEGSMTTENVTARRTLELLEANEHLVVTALRAQADADTATHALEILSRSSELDALTDLPNRQSLLSRFTYAIAIARRTGTQLALLFIDLNNFKQINDTLGHAAGDQVLRLVAKRLATTVRESDTVSRHGGDEFLILLTDVSNAADVAQIIAKLIAALARPARVVEHVLRLTASIGVSLYPQDGKDPAALIEHADAAMYQAKRNGDGGFAFHAAESVDLESKSSILPALHSPLSHYRTALAEQARRHAQLRKANEQLVLAALNAQRLQEAAEQVQQRQTDFLAVIAHELRNPLMPMQHAATLLHRARIDNSLLPRIQATIERQVAHLSRLVGDLLDVSRVSTGKLRLKRQMIDVAQIINEAVAGCRPTMDARQQHCAVQTPPGPLTLYGDPIRLAQIFSNLLDNASKYTPEGGDVELSLVHAPDALVITVSDTGIGISPQVLSKVFEPFAQDPHAIEFNATGLGLGLAVVHELVAAHGGTIRASSAGLGLGSQFTVTLPLTDAGDGDGVAFEHS